MSKFVIFLRDEPTVFNGLSPAEMQAVFQRYRTWRDSLFARGLEPGGRKLNDTTGRVMKRNSGKVVVTDGPYAEAREVLGGLFEFNADSFEQAIEIARDCPHLDFGSIEIREVEVT